MFRLLILFSCFFSVALAQCGNFTDDLCIDHPNCRWSGALTCCLYDSSLSPFPTVSPSVSPTKLITGSPSRSPTGSPTRVTVVPDTKSSTELNGGQISAIVIGLVAALFLLTFGICYYMKVKNRT
jgi:hypothetical protein